MVIIYLSLKFLFVTSCYETRDSVTQVDCFIGQRNYNPLMSFFRNSFSDFDIANTKCNIKKSVGLWQIWWLFVQNIKAMPVKNNLWWEKKMVKKIIEENKQQISNWGILFFFFFFNLLLFLFQFLVLWNQPIWNSFTFNEINWPYFSWKQRV